MEFYRIGRSFTPTVRNSIKLFRLKRKCEKSLNLRLERRKKMIKIVKNWMNWGASKAWR